MRHYQMLILLVLFGLATSTFAMMVAVTEGELVGTADLIILGTVVEDKVLPDAASWTGGQATVTVEKVIKGPQVTSVTVIHAVVPKMPPGMVIMDHGGFMLQPKQQQLFFLARTQGGYTLIGGTQGMRPVGEADKFAKLLQEFPLTVTMKTPVGPFYFGQPVQLSVTVKNRGTVGVTLHNPGLEGYYYAPRMGTYINFNNQLAPSRATMPAPRLEPGAETTLQVPISCAMPPTWQVFTPDTYFQTPIAVRARVFIQPDAPAGTYDKTFIPGYNLASEWAPTLLGFSLPQELQAQ